MKNEKLLGNKFFNSILVLVLFSFPSPAVWAQHCENKWEESENQTESWKCAVSYSLYSEKGFDPRKTGPFCPDNNRNNQQLKIWCTALQRDCSNFKGSERELCEAIRVGYQKGDCKSLQKKTLLKILKKQVTSDSELVCQTLQEMNFSTPTKSPAKEFVKGYLAALSFQKEDPGCDKSGKEVSEQAKSLSGLIDAVVDRFPKDFDRDAIYHVKLKNGESHEAFAVSWQKNGQLNFYDKSGKSYQIKASEIQNVEFKEEDKNRKEVKRKSYAAENVKFPKNPCTAISGEEIRDGSYGSVRTACIAGDCDWVRKREMLGNEEAWGDDWKQISNKFSTEASSLFDLGEDGVAPVLKDASLCVEEGKIYAEYLMRKMDGNLADYLMSHPLTKEDVKDIFNKVRKMHEKNIVHQDLHSKNILYKMVNGNPEFYIADFGESHRYSNKNSKEPSKKVQNFRAMGVKPAGGGVQTDQVAYDIESLVSDLKHQFGIEIKVGGISPVKLHTDFRREKGALLMREEVLKSIGGDSKHPRFTDENSYINSEGQRIMNVGRGPGIPWSSELVAPETMEHFKSLERTRISIDP